MKRFVQWRSQHLKMPETAARNTPLSGHYWQGFMGWFPDLKEKNVVRFDEKRSDFCTEQNFQQMYCSVYEQLVKSGVTIDLGKEKWLDKDGNVCAESDGDEKQGIEWLTQSDLSSLMRLVATRCKRMMVMLAGRNLLCRMEEEPCSRALSRTATSQFLVSPMEEESQ